MTQKKNKKKGQSPLHLNSEEDSILDAYLDVFINFDWIALFRGDQLDRAGLSVRKKLADLYRDDRAMPWHIQFEVWLTFVGECHFDLRWNFSIHVLD